MESVSTSRIIPPAQAHYVLPPALTIETVGDVVAALRDLSLTQGGDLIIDATQTHTITTPGLQTLLSLGRALSSVHGRLLLHESNQTISNAFALIGAPTPFTHGA